jgi:CHAT domain-containing protein
MINRLVTLIFLLFFQLLSGQKNKSFDSIINKIDKGQYPIAWNSISHDYNKGKISPEEKLFLEAKIFRDQGALHLAIESIDQLEVLIYPNKIKEWGEQLLTLKSDLYYQLYEFDLYLKEIEWLEKWRLHFHPSDSLRKAMNYSYRAKYFSAMINADSSRFNTCKALTLFWKNRDESSNLPIYMIYANHVSCLRNSHGFPYDIGFEKQKAYIDTAQYYLNKHFPGNCIEKLRIMQALAIPYYDHISSVQTWVNPTKQTFYDYQTFKNKVSPILRDYKLLAGNKHPYISQIEFFIGMLEVCKLDYPKAIEHFQFSKSANSSCQFEHPVYYMNWNRVSSLIKDIARLKNELAKSNKEIESLLSYRNGLLEAEKVFYMKYFYKEAWKTETEDDVYGMNPFSELCWINTRLYKLTNQLEYANSAWDYAQKEKYIDIVKGKILPERRGSTARMFNFLKTKIHSIRLKNDSLLLAENKFCEFKQLDRNEFAYDIHKNYSEIIDFFKQNNFENPFSASFFTQHLKYNIQTLQQQMKAENSAWISVNHYSNEKQINTMQWVICADTFWVETQTWDSYNQFIPRALQSKLMNYESDSADFLSNELYNRVFKNTFKTLKNANIHRVYFCDDASLPFGNPEVLVTNLSTGNRRYLIQDFTITQKLMVTPDVGFAFKESEKAQLFTYSICPLLSSQFVDLTLARSYSDSIAARLNGKSINAKVSKAQFKKVLENSLILHLFSHGEGSNGIVFSDGNLLPNEVRNIKTNAELVSLVTCESSVGKLIHGDGVKGMTEALINAGAKRVVATQWKIDEKASAILTLNFYKNLSNGMRADSALRMAKLKYLKEADSREQHPSFWGGIILYGEPTEIESLNRFFPFVQPIYVIAFTVFVFLLIFSVQLQFRDNLISIVKNLNRLQ